MRWRWIKATLAVMAPSLAIGALIGAFPGYKTYEYVWKDARFCITCHVHDYASTGWERSSHGKMTTCHDCHHQPLHEYFRELYVLIKDNPKFPKDLHHTPHVPKDLCEACHVTQPGDTSSITGPLSGKEIDKLPKVDRLRLHHVHLNQTVELPLPKEQGIHRPSEFGTETAPLVTGKHPARPITCMDCHGGAPNRAHQFTATDRSCTQCHREEHKQGIVGKTGCRNCHFQDFMTPIAGAPGSAPLRWRITESPEK